MTKIKVNDIKSTSADIKQLTKLKPEKLENIVGGCHGDDVHHDPRLIKAVYRVQQVSAVI